MKYARWKTTDIIKAINEGRVPQPGPPGGELDIDGEDRMEGVDQQQPSATDFGTSDADFPSFPDPPAMRPSPPPPTISPAPSAFRLTPQPPITGQQQQQQPQPSSVSATTDYSAQKAAEAIRGGVYAYDPKVLSNAQKHARFAISAIQYDDIENAVENLKTALRYLEPYQQRR